MVGVERYRHPFQVAHFVVCGSVPEAGPANQSVKIARLRAPRKSLLCWASLGPRAILGLGTRGLSVSGKEPPSSRLWAPVRWAGSTPATGLSSAVGSVSEASQPLLTLSLGLTSGYRRVKWKQMSI